MATKHYTTQADWYRAVEEYKLEREWLQFGLVEALNCNGEVVGTWHGQHCVPNGTAPYGVLNLDKVQ